MLKKLLLVFSMMAIGLSCSAENGAGAAYAEGTHYTVINPPVTVSPDTIEVAEFFWYGCGHCYTFEPFVEQWKKDMPEDVSFRGVPAVWRDVMELHARAYYAAKALGVLDTMNPVIFQAMNVDRKPLSSQKDLAKLFAANGVSEEDFNKAFASFGVGAQLEQGKSQAKSAKISGTPALMVNGKYHISGHMAGGQAEMLKVADFLIEKERAAKGS